MRPEFLLFIILLVLLIYIIFLTCSESMIQLAKETDW